MSNVDRGVYQKKIQRQKRASASVGQKGCQAWGWGPKGMLLREAGGGRYQVESKTWISTDMGSGDPRGCRFQANVPSVTGLLDLAL